MVIDTIEKMKRYYEEQKKALGEPKFWTAMRDDDDKDIWLLERHESLKEAQDRYETGKICIPADFILLMEIPTKLTVQFPKMGSLSFDS